MLMEEPYPVLLATITGTQYQFSPPFIGKAGDCSGPAAHRHSLRVLVVHAWRSLCQEFHLFVPDALGTRSLRPRESVS